MAYETAAQTAVRVRATLKERFPGVKFSVRSKAFSMGSSVDVSWVDGPTQETVRKVASRFENISRDQATGEILSGGNRYVIAQRSFSAALLRQVADKVCGDYGIPVPPVKTYGDGGHAYVEAGAERVGDEYLEHVINRMAHETDASPAAPQAQQETAPHAERAKQTADPTLRELANPDGPATSRQLFALHCILRRDTRGWAITKAEASALIDAAKRGEDVTNRIPA